MGVVIGGGAGDILVMMVWWWNCIECEVVLGELGSWSGLERVGRDGASGCGSLAA